jgi:hypothetical protein
MNPLKNMAVSFGEHLTEYQQTIELCESEVAEKLSYIKNNQEKLRFLSYLKNYVESRYQKHVKFCFDLEKCDENKGYEAILYVVRQNYDSLIGDRSGFNVFEKPSMIFYNKGKYFDGYTELRDRIKEAKESIILIDNNVDAKTLNFFSDKEPGIELRIKTMAKSINEQLKEAEELYNKEIGNLHIGVYTRFRDRFIIIDNSSFYIFNQSINLSEEADPFFLIKIDDPELTQLIMEKLERE